MGISMINDTEIQLINRIIDQALNEDLNKDGDITSEAIFSDNDTASAIIKSKATGILSGAYLLKLIFSKISSEVKTDVLLEDGSQLQKGTIICTLNGPVKAILAGERIALNFLQRLSGIASLTNQYTNAIKGTDAKVLDTRKTTPNLRLLEKKAVQHGGGCNHRFGLFDMILIKDTHVKRSGGVSNALSKAIEYRRDKAGLKIEVEVQSVQEYQEAIQFNPDRIMLDNMSLNEMKQCVQLKKDKNLSVELEASGNITLSTILQVAQTGVDYISSGALTHSAPALDIHLLITG